MKKDFNIYSKYPIESTFVNSLSKGIKYPVSTSYPRGRHCHCACGELWSEVYCDLKEFDALKINCLDSAKIKPNDCKSLLESWKIRPEVSSEKIQNSSFNHNIFSDRNRGHYRKPDETVFEGEQLKIEESVSKNQSPIRLDGGNNIGVVPKDQEGLNVDEDYKRKNIRYGRFSLVVPQHKINELREFVRKMKREHCVNVKPFSNIGFIEQGRGGSSKKEINGKIFTNYEDNMEKRKNIVDRRKNFIHKNACKEREKFNAQLGYLNSKLYFDNKRFIE